MEIVYLLYHVSKPFLGGVSSFWSLYYGGGTVSLQQVRWHEVSALLALIHWLHIMYGTQTCSLSGRDCNELAATYNNYFSKELENTDFKIQYQV